MTGQPYSFLGKEVLLNGRHFGDMIDIHAAREVAEAMNATFVDDPVMPELRERDDDEVSPGTHATRVEGDEYVCRCGVRWSFDEGHDHP